MSGFEQAVKWAGSKAELARRLGVTNAAVSRWVRDGLPPGQAIEIERLSGGELRAVDLVPAAREAA